LLRGEPDVIIDLLHRWLFPPSLASSPRVERWMPADTAGAFDHETRRARIFVRSAVGMVEVVTPIALALMLARQWRGAAVAGAMLVVAANALRLTRAGRPTVARELTLGAMLAAVGLSAWSAGEQLLAVWAWAPMVPVMALSVGGARVGVRWLVNSAVTLLAVWWMQRLAIPAPFPVTQIAHPVSTLASGLGVLVSTLGIAGAYENDLARSVAEAEARNAAIEAARADLEARNRSLLEAQAGLERLNQELTASRDAAEAGGRARSEFLAVMSHEVRTPMNAVIGMTTLLLDSELTDEQRAFVETIRTSGDALLTILNDALDYSKIEAGRVALESLAFNPASDARAVIDLMHGQAAARRNTLTLTVGDNVPKAVCSDPGRVRQVLLNLVSNAVKFTEGGEVSVTLSYERKGRPWIIATVRDTGIGMSAEVQGQLFRPFTQADASTTRRFGGTGLGLAISHRLASLLGGTLAVESAPGVGSTFTLRVPVTLVRGREETPPPGPVSLMPRGPTLRVLVAEDNAVNQKVIALMLQRLGHRVDTVANGAEAIAAVERAPYDVVLMDVQMPEVDGIAATRAIRAMPSQRTTPVVALTANVFAEDRARCTEAGMTDFLPKPVRRDELVTLLARVVGERPTLASAIPQALSAP
jgi:signal transduction histidine kinase/ActR/RegA family two-component response regulator